MNTPVSLLTAVLLLVPAVACAVDPFFKMPGGGTVTVDPDTNRATITRGGVTSPMWDGTYRTEDGSLLIIQQGVVVPNEPVLGARDELAGPEADEDFPVEHIVGYSPCEKLVRQVCGRDDECADTEPCDLARQLLDMEEEERDRNSSRSLTTYTSHRCQTVASDPGLFPPCEAGVP
jgi:hypothetical protein